MSKYQTISFSTYPYLQSMFKERCQIKSVSMAQRMEQLIAAFLNHELGTLAELENKLVTFKEHAPRETKKFKFTVRIDASLYAALKERLSLMNARPATFFTYLMSYEVGQEPSQEDYKRNAELVLETCGAEIVAVVYGIQLFIRVGTNLELEHTRYVLDCCNASDFSKFYSTAITDDPLVNILYISRDK